MSNSDFFRPIHYLGSKLRMLECIENEIDNLDSSYGPVCDLFSGSGTVSNFLSKKRDVISVDVQLYSKVLFDAMTNDSSLINVSDVLNQIKFSEHGKNLLTCFEKLLNYEEKCIKQAEAGEIDGLYEIIENGSIITFESEDKNKCDCKLYTILNETVESMDKYGYINTNKAVITRYYGGLYFSYKQAVIMDIVLDCADTYEESIKDILVGALLSSASDIVDTIGKQFAQPLKVRDSNGLFKQSLKKKILSDRNIDLIDLYEKWLIRYTTQETTKRKTTFIQNDFKVALKQIKDKNISVVYADPPYTRYHYSRYYHVLETICLRDNPIISKTFKNSDSHLSRAIYRDDRHQSAFSIKTQAEEAFNDLFRLVSELKVPLVLSYSPYDKNKTVTPRLQTIDQLIALGKLYFADAKVVSPGKFSHSKLNSSDKMLEANDEAEVLLIFK